MHSLKHLACMVVCETMTTDEQKELARHVRMCAYGVKAIDTIGLELIPFIAIEHGYLASIPYRAWREVMHRWNELHKDVILVNCWRHPREIQIYSTHHSMPAGVFYDDGTGPRETSVEHFRGLLRTPMIIKYDGMDLKDILAEASF